MRRLMLVLAALPFFALELTTGCGEQGEGQLCNTLNNTNADCAAGLQCMPKYGNDLGVCCPPTGSTNPACTGAGTGGTGVGGSGAAGSGTTTSSSTTSSTTTEDGGMDGSTDGSMDGSMTDAG
jgi:hypothetical protein